MADVCQPAIQGLQQSRSENTCPRKGAHLRQNYTSNYQYCERYVGDGTSTLLTAVLGHWTVLVGIYLMTCSTDNIKFVLFSRSVASTVDNYMIVFDSSRISWVRE